MRIVVQRVSKATLRVDDAFRGSIGRGLVSLVGFGRDDTAADLAFMAGKIVALRVFEDNRGRMGLSLRDVGGGLMVVPQFTLYGDCRRGNRPDFTGAGPPGPSRRLYDAFVKRLGDEIQPLVSGDFGSSMLVEIHNDGPVTLILCSERNRRTCSAD